MRLGPGLEPGSVRNFQSPILIAQNEYIGQISLKHPLLAWPGTSDTYALGSFMSFFKVPGCELATDWQLRVAACSTYLIGHYLERSTVCLLIVPTSLWTQH